MPTTAATLTFLGAAGEVTGSCYLVEMPGLSFLVDCGMFQGGREAGGKNRRTFPFDPAAIDFVLLTHAHIDRSGLLPWLAAEGFAGAIHATAPTADLAAVMLRDSAYIQEKEAEWSRRSAGASARQRGSKHPPRRHDDIEVDPLYRIADAERAIALFARQRYEAPFEPNAGMRVVLRDAGHILGSASAEVTLTLPAGSHRIVFSGDLGQPGHPIVRDAVPVPRADTLLVESTYGDRLHRPMDATLDELVEALVRLFGEDVPVRAKVCTIGGLSAHADQGALLSWLGGFEQPPGQNWVVHGESGAAGSFAKAVGERFGWTVGVAEAGQAIVLPLQLDAA